MVNVVVIVLIITIIIIIIIIIIIYLMLDSYQNVPSQRINQLYGTEH
jgi:uncharacterized membrane protein YvbJ